MQNSEARSRVVAEAMTWLSTSYHHHGRIKGAGVDCACLLIEVYAEAAGVPRVEPGFYPTDWHLHRGEELFLGWLAKAGAREIAADQARAGDCCVFRFGRTFSHGGILADDAGLVIHSYIDAGVIATRISEHPLAGRAVRFFTLF